MSKRKLRKKAKPVRNRRMTFKIIGRGAGDDRHPTSRASSAIWDNSSFEVRYKPPRRIPVSETGYRCHFAPWTMSKPRRVRSTSRARRRLRCFRGAELRRRQTARELPLF